MVVNFPHNPTGATLTPGEWQRLVAACRTHGAYLFSDEMYRGLELEPALREIPSAVDAYDRAIVLFGMSKVGLFVSVALHASRQFFLCPLQCES